MAYFTYSSKFLNVYIILINCLAMIICSIEAFKMELTYPKLYKYYWFFYILQIIISCIINGVLIIHFANMNSFILILWIIGFQFMLDMMNRNSLYYIVNVIHIILIIVDFDLLIMNFKGI